jgi:hypothetical protein
VNWQDLSTPPPEGDRVLTSSLGYVTIGTRERGEFFNATGERLVQVDHWAPIPRGATDSLGVKYGCPDASEMAVQFHRAEAAHARAERLAITLQSIAEIAGDRASSGFNEAGRLARINDLASAAGKERRAPMEMLVDVDWQRKRVATDPDLSCDAALREPIGPFQKHQCVCGHGWSAPIWAEQVCPACNATDLTGKPEADPLFIARGALIKIARMRTELRGDFSMGSHQSDIAREALDAIGLGTCLRCDTDLSMGPFGAVDCPACNPDPARG